MNAVTANLSIYYRGALTSCNYACSYCPFAKARDTKATLARDAAALGRFVAWAARFPAELRVLFTPWGEALIRRAYRDAMVTLSHTANVARVAAQTNLSGPLGWLDRAELTRVALWCTYHPSQIARRDFLARCALLDARGVRYAVGMVGLRDDIPEIEAMRAALRPDVYLWVNAYKREPNYYEPVDRERLGAVDPLFSLNARRHASRGQPCRAGHESIAVDADGTARRCHFVPTAIGNIYDDDFAERLLPRRCPNDTCGCYIGYSQLVPLRLERVYGDGLLERIPPPEVTRRVAPGEPPARAPAVV